MPATDHRTPLDSVSPPGLSASEAARRLAAEGPNLLPGSVPGMAAGVGALLVAVLTVPWLRDLMGLVLPPAQGLGVLVGLLTLCLGWLERLRHLHR